MSKPEEVSFKSMLNSNSATYSEPKWVVHSKSFVVSRQADTYNDSLTCPSEIFKNMINSLCENLPIDISSIQHSALYDKCKDHVRIIQFTETGPGSVTNGFLHEINIRYLYPAMVYCNIITATDDDQWVLQ